MFPTWGIRPIPRRADDHGHAPAVAGKKLAQLGIFW
jgi:hypothetical protein